MYRYCLLILIILATSCDQKEESKKEPVNSRNVVKDSLVATLKDIHQKGQLNGFAVAIVDQENILFEGGFGFANKEEKKTYTKNTLQNIGSVSKTLIGVSLLKAQEMGKLDLDDPVNKHLPFQVINPYFRTDTITIRQLALHTSSITDADVYDEESYVLYQKIDSTSAPLENTNENFNAPEKMTSMATFLEKVLSKEGVWYTQDSFIEKKPGQYFEYTNVGATLAALVIEYATGTPYNEFTSTHILKPLGMESSGWSFDSIDMDMHSKLYENPEKALPFYSLITYPDGGLLTSSHELGIYLSELIRGYSGEGKLLNKESYKELFTMYLDDSYFEERDADNPYDDEYNSGIFMGFSPSVNIGHTGGDPGIATFMFFNKETKRGKLLMINTDINNQEGVDQFYSIWGLLEEYQDKL